MNLNELFFFKVFPCSKESKQKINNSQHNEKSCYFYHVSNNNNDEKLIEKDRRREQISLTQFFKKLLSDIKADENFTLSLDTIFEFKKDIKGLNYYIDSLPFNFYNDYIYYPNDVCQNETEFLYHINRYKERNCVHFQVNGKCKNKFCNGIHIYNKSIINDKNNKSKDEQINNGINEFKKMVNKWNEINEVKLKELIDIYNYILSFENKYLSKIQLNEYIKIFLPFQNLSKEGNNQSNIDTKSLIQNQLEEEKKYMNQKIANQLFTKLNSKTESLKIFKNNDIIKVLKLSTKFIFVSKYDSIKLSEVVKYIHAMLNSSDGIILYGVNEHNMHVTGIRLTYKDKDKFKKWFNSEFLNILIKYEDNL